MDSPETQPIEVRRCREDETRAAAHVLAESFHADPAYELIFPDPEKRRGALGSFMRAPVADARRRGTCWVGLVDGSAIKGVAVWQAPGDYPWSLSRQIRSLPAILGVALRAPSSVPHLMRLGSNVDSRFPEDPVWYLQVLGVAPDAQGQGLGTRLLEPAIKRADEENTPCYLETVSKDAKRWYERAGFVVVSQEQLLPMGPSHWIMKRPT